MSPIWNRRRPALTFRRYKDGDTKPLAWQQETSTPTIAQVPTYIQSTPPCRAVARQARHPQLPQHRAWRREAACGRALAGVRLAPPDEANPFHR